MIIDSHVHFWNYHPVKEAWITDEMNAIQRDFLPADVAPLLVENNISGCIAVQADQSDAETQFLLNLAAENGFIKGVVGWISLTEAGIEDKLDNLKNHNRLKGFRHIAQGEAAGFLTDSRVINSIREIGKQGYTYDIVVYNDQLSDAIKLSESLPGQPFILDHCGKPPLKDNNLTQWKTDLKILAENSDMHCKLSGLFTEGHWHRHNETQLFECLDTVLEFFGSRRVLFGSDWPVMLLGGNYSQWIEIVKKHISQFSQQEQNDILCNNAIRFYNI